MAPAVAFRWADLEDQSALADLLQESHAYYWGDDSADPGEARMAAEAILGGGSGCDALIAWAGGRAVGFANVTLLHPALTAAGTLFMKDLFISAGMRGSGLGRAFLTTLGRHAAKLGCARFDWTAETDNPRAIAFYEGVGGEVVSEKVYFRIAGADLAAFGDEG
ncbi:MAG: GNAT family N-acetyltransferase [Pseudomonadota bacterium]